MRPAAQEARLASCTLRSHGGVETPQAQTVANLVCDEVRAVGGTSESYVVDVERIGIKTILRLTVVDVDDRVIDSRRLTLNNIDESTVAAPRIAKALVLRQPLDETARVDNLVGEETRVYKKKHGEFLKGVGILGIMIPTANNTVGAGVVVPFLYETPSYAIGGSLLVGVSSDHDKHASQVALSIGGRGFMSESDSSLFWGGGLAVSWLSASSGTSNGYTSTTSSKSGSGLGAYGEIGFEVMRLHSSRLVFAGRVDLPFYSLKSEEYALGLGSASAEHSTYNVPLSLSVAYMW